MTQSLWVPVTHWADPDRVPGSCFCVATSQQVLALGEGEHSELVESGSLQLSLSLYLSKMKEKGQEGLCV